MEENIIEVENLTKIYENGNVLAVDNIDLHIKQGEIFALLGPNGAGKTTTISMLATLLSNTAGQAIVNGYDIKKHPDKVRKSIGIVFQEPSLDGDMKGIENLEIHAILYGMPKKIRNAKIKEVLKLVDLEDKAEIFVRNYSGGMKRRLEIARGLLHEPKILFLDEPTLGLDPQTRRKIWEKIKELNKGESKITILITTHYMEEADELADRICIMDHGKIIALDTSKNLKKQLSGDVIDIEFDKIEDTSLLPSLISQLKEIPGIKHISLGDSKNNQEEIPLNLPKNIPNIDPNVIKARMQEMMQDPKKLLMAWKNFPMSQQMFQDAPLEMKKKIANMFNDDLIKDIPENIREVIINIKNGVFEDDNSREISKISISCEHGGKQLPLIMQNIDQKKIIIKNIYMHQPTLEDVFLHYVGTKIREETSDRTKDIKKRIQMRQLTR
ncbi:MAG: ATP-binding cassette domain-containing protein [Candidatus Lokiarchaeota archaeon]|nr:ATP-binding cassette domain-containing protein [Candidatus Lokiarchaeota archaeon]